MGEPFLPVRGQQLAARRDGTPVWLSVNLRPHRDDLDGTQGWLGGAIPYLVGSAYLEWLSDRDGYQHLYRYDYSGKLIRQVTRGQWTRAARVRFIHVYAGPDGRDRLSALRDRATILEAESPGTPPAPTTTSTWRPARGSASSTA